MLRFAPHIAILGLQLTLLGYSAARANQAKPAPQVIRGRSFELVDEAGNVRAQLRVAKSKAYAGGDAVILEMRDSRKKTIVKLAAERESGRLELGAYLEGHVRLSSKSPSTKPADWQPAILSIDGQTQEGGGNFALSAGERGAIMFGWGGPGVGGDYMLHVNPSDPKGPTQTLSGGSREMVLHPTGVRIENPQKPDSSPVVWPERLP